MCVIFVYSATCEDYKVLENMNKLSSLKYMEMKDISINISRNLQDLNQKCEKRGNNICIYTVGTESIHTFFTLVILQPFAKII